MGLFQTLSVDQNQVAFRSKGKGGVARHGMALIKVALLSLYTEPASVALETLG
jgi:hypothetical protein